MKLTCMTLQVTKAGHASALIDALDSLDNENNIPTDPTLIVTANPVGGNYYVPQNVVLTATDDQGGNPTIYYTTDGSNPRTSHTRAEYITPILINITTTLKFSAIDSEGNWSSIYTEKYTINIIPTDFRVETVTINGNTATGVTNYPVSSTIKNYGGTITDTFYVSYYLSTDTIRSSNDRYIGHATVKWFSQWFID